MKPSLEELCTQAYWAHAQSWWLGEKARFDTVQSNWNEQKKPELVADLKAISVDYSVHRHVVKDIGQDSTDSNFEKYLDRLFNVVSIWPKTLGAKCEQLASAAVMSKDEGETRSPLCSGMSKLAWFLAPKGWTMFDTFAANAIGIKNGTSPDRMKSFYEKLLEFEIEECWKEISNVLNKHQVNDLWAERITDKMLWIKGSQGKKIIHQSGVAKLIGKEQVERNATISLEIANGIRRTQFGKFLTK
jgi:hypothetical protein